MSAQNLQDTTVQLNGSELKLGGNDAMPSCVGGAGIDWFVSFELMRTRFDVLDKTGSVSVTVGKFNLMPIEFALKRGLDNEKQIASAFTQKTSLRWDPARTIAHR